MEPPVKTFDYRRLPIHLFGAGWRLARAEAAAAGAVLLACLGVATFLGVADEVGEGEEAFDWAILRALRVGGDPAVPIGPSWLHRAAAELTGFGDTWVLAAIVVMVAGFLLMQKKPAQAAMLTAAVVGGTLLSEGLKGLFGRDRPPEAWRLVEVVNDSFPSGHAMLSAVTYLTLGALVARVLTRRRLKAYVLTVAFGLAGLVGLTRIYLGAHWTTDVVAGWSLGTAWAMACWLTAFGIERLRARVAPATGQA
jgi:undecaprenyl-diphosphatase